MATWVFQNATLSVNTVVSVISMNPLPLSQGNMWFNRTTHTNQNGSITEIMLTTFNPNIPWGPYTPGENHQFPDGTVGTFSGPEQDAVGWHILFDTNNNQDSIKFRLAGLPDLNLDALERVQSQLKADKSAESEVLKVLEQRISEVKKELEKRDH